jgi:anti-sigma regulatory factor (Ser/Thr protein kinase)
MTRLADFTVPSEPGNERLVLAKVADVVAGHGLPDSRLERLKTAVAEAAMNAIEHGNHNRPELPVTVEVDVDASEISVTVTDLGGSETRGDAVQPDLDLKLAGQQSPRGWGLFLIRHMVDAMDETTQGMRHTVRLVMRTAEGDTR